MTTAAPDTRTDTACGLPGDADGSFERAGRFVRLVADAYWELDATLRYTAHAEARDARSPDAAEAIGAAAGPIGHCRLATLNASLAPSEALERHHELMRAHRSIDIVMPLAPPGTATLRYVRVVADPRLDGAGAFAGYVGCERDVTDRVILRQELAFAAAHDELTGICNRRAFEQRLASLHAAVQGDDSEYALCLLDLDRFKLVNDTAGHAAGDRLLCELVALMRDALEEDELLARLGGDEFGFVMHADQHEAQRRADALIDRIAAFEFVWDERRFSVGACIGITPLARGTGSQVELMDRADSACYTAKRNGRNRSVVFSETSEAWRRHRDELDSIAAIKDALRANRLRLFMQEIRPVTDAVGPAHHEILLRLEQENGVLLPPADFIPVAERFGFMQDLDRWVLEHCLETLDAFEASGEARRFSVNLSGNTLSDIGALEHIAAAVHGAGELGASLCFEITETAAIGNLDTVVGFMRELKALGVRFALDDFGAGQSSFAYLRSLPIDWLKIDGYFIRHLSGDQTNRAILAAFIGLARDLGIRTVAESVETRAIARQATELGIDYVQGYGIARPVDVDDTLARVLARSVRRVVSG